MSFEIALSPRVIVYIIIGILLLINYVYLVPKALRIVTMNIDMTPAGCVSIIYLICAGFVSLLLMIYSISWICTFVCAIIEQDTWFPILKPVVNGHGSLF